MQWRGASPQASRSSAHEHAAGRRHARLFRRAWLARHVATRPARHACGGLRRCGAPLEWVGAARAEASSLSTTVLGSRGPISVARGGGGVRVRPPGFYYRLVTHASASPRACPLLPGAGGAEDEGFGDVVTAITAPTCAERVSECGARGEQQLTNRWPGATTHHDHARKTPVCAHVCVVRSLSPSWIQARAWGRGVLAGLIEPTSCVHTQVHGLRVDSARHKDLPMPYRRPQQLGRRGGRRRLGVAWQLGLVAHVAMF